MRPGVNGEAELFDSVILECHLTLDGFDFLIDFFHLSLPFFWLGEFLFRWFRFLVFVCLVCLFFRF